MIDGIVSAKLQHTNATIAKRLKPSGRAALGKIAKTQKSTLWGADFFSRRAYTGEYAVLEEVSTL